MIVDEPLLGVFLWRAKKGLTLKDRLNSTITFSYCDINWYVYDFDKVYKSAQRIFGIYY
jgi:hypothetical protein